MEPPVIIATRPVEIEELALHSLLDGLSSTPPEGAQFSGVNQE